MTKGCVDAEDTCSKTDTTVPRQHVVNHPIFSCSSLDGDENAVVELERFDSKGNPVPEYVVTSTGVDSDQEPVHLPVVHGSTRSASVMSANGSGASHAPSAHGSSLDANELEFPEGGLQAWLVVLGSFCAMAAVFGVSNTAAVFQSYLAENQLASYSPFQIGWIFSLNLFLVFFVGIQVGPIFDHYGPRLLVIVGFALSCASLFLFSISTSKFVLVELAI